MTDNNVENLLFTLNDDELEELNKSSSIIDDEDHLLFGTPPEDHHHHHHRHDRMSRSKSESDVDWELTLSLETTLQLIEGEPLNKDSAGSADASEELIQRILDVCRGRGGLPEHLRGKVWLILLNLHYNNKSTKHPLNQIFDLQHQNDLRSSCTSFALETYTTTPSEHSSIVSTLESILTSYLKYQNLPFEKGQQIQGYLQILKPLLTLSKLTETQLYNLFRAVVTQYVPRDVFNETGLPFHIFRLLLLYHEPEVCSILDSLKVNSFSYASQWFLSLFSSSIQNLESILVLWDVYYQYRDPFLIYHMALVLVLNAKDRLLSIKQSDAEISAKKVETVELLSSLPAGLEPSDIPDFLTISHHYANQTPNSYRRMFESALYGNESFLTLSNSETSLVGTTSPCRRVAMQSLCLPVSAEELLNSIRMAKSLSSSSSQSNDSRSSTDGYTFVRFFVVDCRPAEQYNSGRLPTAFHLDCALMLLEPIKYNTAVQGLLLAQKDALNVGAAAGGEHLCFVGSGREEEDQYVNMVVSSFLQRNTQKVALLSGGYQALHELLHPDNIEDGLLDHSPSTCPECVLHKTSTTTTSSRRIVDDGAPETIKSKIFTAKLNQFGSTLKAKSVEMKGKLFDYIGTTPGASSSSTSTDERHVQSSDKNKSKPYRNLQTFFVIDDISPKFEELEDGGRSPSPQNKDNSNLLPGTKIPSLKSLFKQHPNHWSCSEVMSDGSHYEGHVIVTNDILFMIRELDRDTGEVSINRVLSSVIKITSKKKHPELITFKYGHVVKEDKDGDNQGGESTAEITHADRFYLPTRSKEFVACVKKFIDSKNCGGE